MFRGSFQKKISPLTMVRICQQLLSVAAGATFDLSLCRPCWGAGRVCESSLPISASPSVTFPPHHPLQNLFLPCRFRRRRSRCSPRRRYSHRSRLEVAGGGWWTKTQMRGGGNFWKETEPLPRAADRRGRSG